MPLRLHRICPNIAHGQSSRYQPPEETRRGALTPLLSAVLERFYRPCRSRSAAGFLQVGSPLAITKCNRGIGRGLSYCPPEKIEAWMPGGQDRQPSRSSVCNQLRSNYHRDFSSLPSFRSANLPLPFPLDTNAMPLRGLHARLRNRWALIVQG